MKRIERDLISYVVVITTIAVALVIEKLLVLSVIPLLLYLFPAKMSVKVKGSEFRRPVYVGDEVSLTAEIIAYGLGYLKLKCEIDGLVEVTHGSHTAGGFVPGVRTFRIWFRGKAMKRGKVNFGRVSCTSEDVFLLKSATWSLDLDLSSEVKVRVRKVKKVKTKRVFAKTPLPDIDVSKIGVPGTDFREIRSYRSGDPIKFINWKASARKGEVLVNEFEVEGKRTVWFVINTSDHEFFEREYLENALSAAASLCHYFVNRGHKVALTLTGERTTIYPDVGRRQFYRIIKELTIAEKGTNAPLDSVMETKRMMMYHMPYVIYITSIHDDGRVVSELMKSGIPVKQIVVEGREYSHWLARAVKKVALRNRLRSGAEIVRDVIAVRA